LNAALDGDTLALEGLDGFCGPGKCGDSLLNSNPHRREGPPDPCEL